MKQMLIATADTDEKILGGIFILAGAGLFFWFMYAAFRNGETSIGDEAGSFYAKKEKNPVGFYSIVDVHFHMGVLFLWCFYKYTTHYFLAKPTHSTT